MDKQRWADAQNRNFDFEDLKEIFKVLRGPEGCPWDKAQTHQSIRANAIEEAYELVDAIDRNDTDNMIEELGDNLLQVFFHIELANESGAFGYTEVINRLCRKLISRHTHIFGADKIESTDKDRAGKAMDVWEKNKTKEKKEGQTIPHFPDALSALMKSDKIQNKAAKVGFEWKSMDGALDKVREEFEELAAEIQSGNKSAAESEMGDLLFALVKVCRFLDIEPETALNKTNSKFLRRFNFVEKELAKTGKTPQQSNLAEMDNLWNEAKKEGL